MVETNNNEIPCDNKAAGNRKISVVEPKSARMNVEKRNACGNVEQSKGVHAGVKGSASAHSGGEEHSETGVRGVGPGGVAPRGVDSPGACRGCGVVAVGAVVPSSVPVHEAIMARLVAMGDEAKARHLMRFFKTGPGQYGEGDRFLGVTVPGVRAIVREYRREVTVDDVMALTASSWHEVRLAGFLSLIEIYERLCRQHSDSGARAVVEMYLSLIDRGNNWDLVDLVAPKILGHRLVGHPAERHLLGRLAAMDGHLWHQRVAIVATWPLIRAGEYDDTLSLARALLRHPHDLIHKAVGWMLREVGKRGGHDELRLFLDDNAAEMPRTMLRYAIERLDESVRRHYMSLGRPN